MVLRELTPSATSKRLSLELQSTTPMGKLLALVTPASLLDRLCPAATLGWAVATLVLVGATLDLAAATAVATLQVALDTAVATLEGIPTQAPACRA